MSDSVRDCSTTRTHVFLAMITDVPKVVKLEAWRVARSGNVLEDEVIADVNVWWAKRIMSKKFKLMEVLQSQANRQIMTRNNWRPFLSTMWNLVSRVVCLFILGALTSKFSLFELSHIPTDDKAGHYTFCNLFQGLMSTSLPCVCEWCRPDSRSFSSRSLTPVFLWTDHFPDYLCPDYWWVTCKKEMEMTVVNR